MQLRDALAIYASHRHHNFCIVEEATVLFFIRPGTSDIEIFKMSFGSCLREPHLSARKCPCIVLVSARAPSIHYLSLIVIMDFVLEYHKYDECIVIWTVSVL